MSSKTILIVDDDDLLRDFYSRILTTQGYNVKSAFNGDEAVGILEDDNIDLVIADLLMPIRSGWELIEFMKHDEKFKNIPIVAVTGLSTSIEEFGRVKKYCEAIINKSDFDLNSFVELIQKLLDKD